MANQLAVLDQGRPTLPAELAGFFEEESNVAPKATTPTLGVTGKIWTIGLNGEKTKLMRRDVETGDETPVGVMRVVVLDYAKRRGRAYYEGNYDPDNVAMPVCWSDDGVKPDDAVPANNKQHTACEGCPMAVKGSKVSDANKAMTACGQHRMVAVVPANKLDFTPLRLKLAVTSDWDKDRKVDDGYMGFQQYTDMLRAKKVAHTAMVVTKMKFDPDVAYPKVLFSVDSWVDPVKLEKEVKPIVKSDAVKSLISGTYTPNGIDGTKKIGTTTDAAAPSGESTVKVDPAKQAADAAAAATAKAAAEKEAAKLARKAAKDKAAKDAAEAAAKAAAVAAAPDDEDDGEVLLPGQAGGETAKVVSPPAQTNGAAPPTQQVVAPKAADVPSDVSSLLAEWGAD